MARACARVDSGLDKAKICPDRRVDPDRPRLQAVFGEGQTFLHSLCQYRKSPGSFNHLVGEQLKGVGHGEAEGRGGLEINDEFVFERELNWQIARICASQNLVHV
jgi:hypothetical protein